MFSAGLGCASQIENIKMEIKRDFYLKLSPRCFYTDNAKAFFFCAFSGADT